MSVRIWVTVIATVIILSLVGFWIFGGDKETIEYSSAEKLKLESSPQQEWVITGDSVWIDDDRVFINVTPHTSNHPIIQVQPKTYTGDVDIILGFDTTQVEPLNAYTNPHFVNVEKSYTCNYEFNYTTNPKYFWCYMELEDENNETYHDIIFEHEWETADQPSKTAYWNENELVWNSIGGTFERKNKLLLGFNKWYIRQGIPVEAGEDYYLKLDLKLNAWEVDDHKYFFGIKPSDETLEEAILNDHFYYIDPWTDGSDYHLTNGLMHYYKFDEESGTVVVDERNSVNGTIVGGVNVNNTACGKIGTGFNFTTISASTPNVGITVNSMASTAGSYTISAWMTTLTNITNPGTRVLFDTQSGRLIAYSEQAGNGLAFYDGTGPDYTTIHVNHTFSHYVFVFDGPGQDVYYYIDGSLEFTDNNKYGSVNIGTATDIGANYLESNSHYGCIDEFAIWNRTLNSTEIAMLYNSGSGNSYFEYTPYTEDPPPIVGLNLPGNYANLTLSDVSLNCTVTDNSGLTNVSLYVNGVINSTNSSPINNTVVNFDLEMADADYNWTCDAYDDANQQDTTTTRYFSVHTIAPTISPHYPTGTINYLSTVFSTVLNWTIAETGQDLYTHISHCGYTYGGTTTILNSTQCLLNETTFSYLYGSNNMTLFVNDTFNLTGSNTTSWTPKVIETAFSYNANTIVTSEESFVVNFTTNGSTPTDAKLYYNGIPTTATITSLGGNNFSLSAITDVGSSPGVFPVIFEFDLAGLAINSTSRSQTVSTINFAICNATFNDTFLTFSFKDEGNLSILSAANDLTNVDYWIGSGATSSNYIYSNSTANATYSFCFYPSSSDVTVNMTFKYSASGYPIRTFVYTEETLTNSITNQTLYLLSSDDGIYSSIQVVDSAGNVISNVAVTMERQIAGTWVTVGQQNTGDDGVVTFWVNPNYPHRITAVKSGYTTAQVTITPSQTIYTLTMVSSVGEVTYSSGLDGVRWATKPSSGIVLNGTRLFNSTVTAENDDLVNCKLELVNASNTASVLNSSTDITNSSYCFVEVSYNSAPGDIYFGRLSINTTSTGGFVVVDADWKWIIDDQMIKGWRKLTSIFSDLATMGEFGEGNEREFNILMLFFIISTILIGIFHYFTGVDISGQSVSVWIIVAIAWLASFGGILTVPLNSTVLADTFFNKYAIAFIITLFGASFTIKSLREGNE